MKMRLGAVGLITIMAAVGTELALAQGTNVNLAETAAARTDDTTALLKLSRELTAYGRKNKDALSLIVAAGMRQQVSLKPVDRKPETEGAAPPAAAAPDPSEITVDGLLNEAKGLAGKDPTIAGLIDDVKASASKGRVQGPAYNTAQLEPKGTQWYKSVAFQASRYAEVYVEASGSTDVNLYVYDENGNLVCRDTDSAAMSYCGWTPAWSGKFNIKVVNRGAAANSYKLVTN